MNLTAKQIGQRGTLAAIGDVHQLDADVIILNNSPAMWGAVPLPADAMLILSGLALA